MAHASKKKPAPKAKGRRSVATVEPEPQRRERPPATKRDAGVERAAPQVAEVDAEALEFIEAIDRFKKQNGRPFPSWSEVLLVLRQLGYRRP
jgi:hypothetical protein